MRSPKTILAFILSTSIAAFIATALISTWIAGAFSGPTASPPGGTTALTVDPTTGNVGIGTAPSIYKLDINGSVRLQPAAQPTGANGVVYYDLGANKFKCYEGGAWNDCVGGGAATEVLAGNVIAGQFGSNKLGGNFSFPASLGIGILTPQSALHVAGTGYIQLDTVSAKPLDADCDADSEAGRMKFDAINDIYYVCSGLSGGWVGVNTYAP